MQLILKINGVNSAVRNKVERNADGTTKQTAENLSQVSARDDKNNVLTFITDYENGKGYELGKELTVTIE